MIASVEQIHELWDKYQLSDKKRKHVELVAKVAIFLSDQLSCKLKIKINKKLLLAAALLHDIDKNVPKLHGEIHPQAAVRILIHEGMGEVAELVKTHSLYTILDPLVFPKSWEGKILFLADKMVKYEILTVDKRFALWRAEDLPAFEQKILKESYAKVKALEKEILAKINIKAERIREILS